jgi:NAD(P)-dependent dehydrogenase (short-subunit alcohol dehydrogenase family)
VTQRASRTAAAAVVITGSTRGLGFAMAREFLERGCRVTICGRTPEGVQEALQRLKGYGERADGRACDVRRPEQVEGLWKAAAGRWGRVDIWVNCAGIPQAYVPAWELPTEEATRVVETNVLGVVHGSRVAMRGMRAQGGGAIYNVEGWGSNGQRRKGLTLYGATKRFLRYFTRGLADEAEGGPVLVGTLSPGMMVTEFLTGPMRRMAEGENPAEAGRMRRVVNIIGDRPETVARFLVPRMLSNHRNRAQFTWLTGAKAMGRFLTAGLRRRDLFTH